MRFDVVLRGFAGMVVGLQAVTVRDMGVMAGEIMLTLVMMPGGFAMVFGRIFVMFGSGVMMIGLQQSAHRCSPLDGGGNRLTTSERCGRGDSQVTVRRTFVRLFKVKTNVLHKPVTTKAIVTQVPRLVKNQPSSAA
jgi:hypothetical protein